MAKFRILIADDHPAIRKNLRSLLESHQDWELAGEASNGREAVEASARLRPDLVITDIDMPELSGLETVRQIRERDPDSSIVVLTMHDSPALAKELRKAEASVVVKSEASERLVAAIHEVQRRRGWLSGAIVARPRHAITFFRTNAEAEGVLLPFIREGLERGERIVHLVDARDSNARIGGVEVAAFDGAIHGPGGFDHDAVMGGIADILRDSESRGIPLTRIIGDTAWMMEHNPRFAGLERRYNDLLADFDDVIVCAYDLTKFSDALVMEGLRAHPLVFAGAAFQHNPFFAG